MTALGGMNDFVALMADRVQWHAGGKTDQVVDHIGTGGGG
jgi:hypothetical protein